MTPTIYVTYPRYEADMIKKVISEVNDYLHGKAYIHMSSTSDYDILVKSDVVLCILSGNVMDCGDFEEELKSASNLNKSIIGILLESKLSMKERLNLIQIRNRIRLGCFEWKDIEEKNSLIIQLTSILGLEPPLCRPTGIKLKLDIVSKDGFYLKIDDNARGYSSGRSVIVFVDSSPHKIIVQSVRYPYCSIEETIAVSSMTNRDYNLDAVIDELGYDGELKIGGDLYVGWIKHQKPNGHGTYTTVEGNVFVGDFTDGEIKSGSLTDNLGNLYYGSFHNWHRHGKGRQIFRSGHKYDGYWSDDKFSGQGILQTPSETEYEGRFENNKLVEGKITYPDGSCYVGQSCSWKRHGFGKMTKSDGSSQEGMWSYDVYIGK